ncbi:baeRF2 domain-containing protein [Streptomyces sp. SYSU K217416]
MRLSFLEPLYAEPGPFASVYLDTSRDVEHAERAIALRWRRLRDDLTRQGADRALLEVMEEVVGADTEIPGMHGQAVFAAHGALVLDGELPKPPAHDSARYSTLPDAMPLVTQHVPEIPYVAVTVHYGGLPTAETRGWVKLDAETGTWPASNVTQGERLHRRVAVAAWHHTAVRLGHLLDEWARRTHADAVVMGGDEWACNVLVRRLPHALRDRVVRVGGPTPTDTGRALLEPQLNIVFRGRMAVHDRALVDIFIGRRALHGAAAEGLSAIVAALQRGQVAALLLNHPPAPHLRLWAGPQPTQLALTEEELISFGVRAPREERADEALMQALVGTGAELVLVPESELTLYEGVGALLRYTDPGTPS